MSGQGGDQLSLLQSPEHEVRQVNPAASESMTWLPFSLALSRNPSEG